MKTISENSIEERDIIDGEWMQYLSDGKGVRNELVCRAAEGNKLEAVLIGCYVRWSLRQHFLESNPRKVIEKHFGDNRRINL